MRKFSGIYRRCIFPVNALENVFHFINISDIIVERNGDMDNVDRICDRFSDRMGIPKTAGIF